MEDLAIEIRDTVHDFANSSPAPAQAESTMKRKGHGVTFMETGGMMDDDSVIIRDDSHSSNIFKRNTQAFQIQGNPDMINQRSKSDYNKILSINAQGSEYIPERDVFEMAYDAKRTQIRRLAVEGFKREILDAMN